MGMLHGRPPSPKLTERMPSPLAAARIRVRGQVIRC
jgi:hypothetical protein